MKPENPNCYKSWYQFRLISPHTDIKSMSLLMDKIDEYIQAGNIIKTGRSTTVSVVSVQNQNLKHQFFVKRYNSKGFFYSLLRSIIPSRAITAWKASRLLKSVGIPTPVPLAALEKRWGPFKWKSYIVHEFFPDAIHASQFFLEGAQPTDKWSSVAQKMDNILILLKKYHIVHGDLKAQNFIISDNNPLLVDLDALKQIKNANIFNRYHKKDIKRFERNWIKYQEINLLFKNLLKKYNI